MTLFVVQASGADEAALARARFIPDTFSWGAFVFAQAWLLYRGLWLAFAVWVGLEALFIVVVAPHVSGAVMVAAAFLAHLYIGLDGNRLRQGRGAALTDLVEARDRDEAEATFYSRPRADGGGA